MASENKAKMVRFSELGPPTVLKLVDEDIPIPGENEIVIAVKAIGLNRAESLYVAGYYLYQPKNLEEQPAGLGYEVSGDVAAVGKGSEAYAVGDRVATFPLVDQRQYHLIGTHAKVNINCVTKIPEAVSYEVAAASYMQYLTAYGPLLFLSKVQEGAAVVITASSSSVGLAAIQIVNQAGGISIATTRTSKKKQQLIDAGAQHVIATEEEDLVARIMEITGQKGANIVFDPVAGEMVKTLSEACAYKATYYLYGALSFAPVEIPLVTFLNKAIRLIGWTLFELLGDAEQCRPAVEWLNAKLSEKAFTPIIDKQKFTLDQIVEAYTYQESNKQFGKILVTV